MKVTFLDDAAPDGCADGVQSGSETDVDCGGPSCAACAAGKGCSEDRDCQSALCLLGTCAAGPTCSDGTMNAPQSPLMRMRVADLDRDGHDDLAMTDSSGNTIAIWRGIEAGKLAPALTLPAPHVVRALTTGDFNGDGKPDIAVTVDNGQGTHELALYLNRSK